MAIVESELFQSVIDVTFKVLHVKLRRDIVIAHVCLIQVKVGTEMEILITFSSLNFKFDIRVTFFLSKPTSERMRK